MLVFINPRALGSDMKVARTQGEVVNSRASQMGIGGYYMVTKVNNIIESGKFETTLELKETLPLYEIGEVQEPTRKTATTPAAEARDNAARAVENGDLTVEEANAILSRGGNK